MALMFTGLSREAARFQARSAFSGVGYTTQEAESIVNHPVRRKIVMILMLLGNIGIATVSATVIVSLTSTLARSVQYQLVVLGVLTVGLLVLWAFFSSRWVERRMNKTIAWALKRFTDLDVRDYVALLKLSHGYSVSEFIVEPKHWIANRVLKDLRLSDEGILVLGIRKPDGTYKGIPRAHDVIEVHDTLILYGSLARIRALDRRKSGVSGDRDHIKSVEDQAEKEAIGFEESE